MFQIFASSAYADEPLSRPVYLDIPDNTSLEDALIEWGTKAGMTVMINTQAVDHRMTHGIRGTLTARDALYTLLKGTGLSFTQDGTRIRVVPTTRTTKSASRDTRVASAFAQSSDFELQTLTSVGNPMGDSQNDARRGPPPDQKLAEVVVTAQKRVERLQDVPSSLTALSSDTLQTQGVIGFSDYMTLVPSLADFSGGASGHGAVILRGLNTGYYQTSNTIGYYVDDIPFSATSPLSFGAVLSLDPDLTDVDHLEVLKGPQATLYGASTLGGLIKVVTNKPDLTSISGAIHVDGLTIDGGGSGYGLTGIVNVPLIPDHLAFRVSAFDRDIPGYMTNTILGTTDRDITRKEGARISLLWVPVEGLDVQMSVFYQRLQVNGTNYEFVDPQTLVPTVRSYTYSSFYDPEFKTDYHIYNATINYRLGSVGTLSNSTSYALYDDQEFQDATAIAGFLNAYAPTPVPASAAQPQVFGPILKKISDELRFTAERLGPFEWLAGLFYTREQINYPYYLINAIPPNREAIPGPNSVILGTASPATYKEQAVFADLTYYLSQSIDFTAGGRYSHNQEMVSDVTTGFIYGNTEVSNSSSDTDFTYLAALNYHISPDVSTYARVATSYRPGGPELTPVPGFTSFKPDSLTNYEIGMKDTLLSGTLRTDVALYYMDWKDVQMSFLDNNIDVISNGGRASSRGVEIDAEYAPFHGLTMSLAAAYTGAKLDSVSAGVTAVTGGVAGNTLPFTPKWAGSATIDYALPLTGNLLSTYGATIRYQGSKWSDYPGDPINTGVVIPAYDTVSIRTGVQWDRYKLQFRVDNLFNAQGLDTVVQGRFSPTINPPANAAIIPPRTFVLSLDASF